jgi:hypothetical protein
LGEGCSPTPAAQHTGRPAPGGMQARPASVRRMVAPSLCCSSCLMRSTKPLRSSAWNVVSSPVTAEMMDAAHALDLTVADGQCKGCAGDVIAEIAHSMVLKCRTPLSGGAPVIDIPEREICAFRRSVLLFHSRSGKSVIGARLRPLMPFPYSGMGWCRHQGCGDVLVGCCRRVGISSNPGASASLLRLPCRPPVAVAPRRACACRCAGCLSPSDLAHSDGVSDSGQ